MIKKIVLLLALALTFGFVQNSVSAQDNYGKTFYLNNIKKDIESNWLIPNNAKGKSAVVSFVIEKNGTVSNVGLVRSSKDTKFDDSAIAAVYKPFIYAKPEVPITVEVFLSPELTDVAILNPEDSNKDVKHSNIVNVASRKSYVDFSSYTSSLETRIDSNWVPQTKKKAADAIFSVDIDKTGALTNIDMIKSSCRKKLDRNIYDAISKSVPMEALPSDYKADSAKIQLAFNYKKQDNPSIPSHFVSASVNTIKGYDDYVALVQKIISTRLDGRRYFFHKDLTLELVINSDGQLNYVKIKKPSKDSRFDRQILATIQTATFPPIPKELGMSTVKLNYKALTQRGYLFPGVYCSFVYYLGTARLISFPL